MSEPNDEKTTGGTEPGDNRRLAARVVAALSVLLIAFCGWSAWSYAQGGNPLAFLGSQAFQTVAEESAQTGTAAITVAVASDAAVESDSQTASTDAATSYSSSQAENGASASSGSKGSSGSKEDSSSGGSEESGDKSGSGSSSGSGSGSGSSGNGGSSDDSSESYSGITVYVTVDGSLGGAGSDSATVVLDEGATVYDALVATGIDVNAWGTSNGLYVGAIGGLAEKLSDDYPESGWKYAVNGVDGDRSCAKWTLSDGDSVAWRYVLDANG